MLKKYIPAVAIFIALLTSPAFAQGEFIDDDKNGFGLSPQYIFGDGYSGIGVNAGYSVNGRVDINFTYAENDNNDIKSYSQTFTVYKKERFENKMYGLFFTGGLLFLDPVDNATFAVAGIGAFSNLYVSEDLIVQPLVAGTLLINTDRTSDRAEAGLDAGVTVLMNRQKAIRPFVHAGLGLTAEHDNEFFGTVDAGLLAVW